MGPVMTQAVDVSDSFTNWRITDSPNKSVDDIVQGVLKAAEPPWNRPERREQRRYPFSRLLSLTPITEDDLAPIGPPLTVIGKNLALRGLDFYHTEPLTHRRMIVSFDDTPGDVHLVLIVTWCRFLRPGWYDSGGRFTHVVTPGKLSTQTITHLT